MLGDLEFQLFGLESAGEERALHGGGEVVLLKLAGGDVDGDGALEAEATLECGDFVAGLNEGPFADGDDEAGLFGDRDEGVGADDAKLGAVPTEEGLYAEHVAVFEGDLGLIENLEL